MNNKKMSHDLIKFAAASTLQCVFAQGEYTLPTTKMEIEPLCICPSNQNITPFAELTHRHIKPTRNKADDLYGT